MQRAELSTILDLMMLAGMITPSEFMEVMTKKLQRIDDERRIAAGHQSTL